MKKKTAMVTGASIGIGRAIAIHLSRLGLDLILIARSKSNLESVKSQCSNSVSVKTIPADISSNVGLELIKKELNDQKIIDVFVHCASGKSESESAQLLKNSDHNLISELINTNIKGTISILKAVEQKLINSISSNVILFSSDWALRGSHGPSVFSATKSFIAQLAHTIRREYAKNNISITTIFPGDVASYDKDWESPIWDLDDSIESVLSELGNERIPLIDIAETIEFIINRKLSRIEEIYIAPNDSSYEY